MIPTTRTVVLAATHSAARHLAALPGSPYVPAVTPAEIGLNGAWVLGCRANSFHNAGPLSIRGGLSSTYLVAWNLHAQDMALKLANLDIPSPDPRAVERRIGLPFGKREFEAQPLATPRRPPLVGPPLPQTSHHPTSHVGAFFLSEASQRTLPRHNLTSHTVFTLVRDTAMSLGIDPALALGLAYEESRLNPEVRASPAGARGVMQLMPSVIQDYSVRDPDDPYQNVPVGLALLKAHLTRTGEYAASLASYRSGRRNVLERGLSPGDIEYVTRVMNWRADFQRILGQALIAEGP